MLKMAAGDAARLNIAIQPEQVGTRIRVARYARKMTMGQLGSLVNRSNQAVAHWETGQADAGLVRLLELSKHLEVDPLWLMAGVKARIDPGHVEDSTEWLSETLSKDIDPSYGEIHGISRATLEETGPQAADTIPQPLSHRNRLGCRPLRVFRMQ